MNKFKNLSAVVAATTLCLSFSFTPSFAQSQSANAVSMNDFAFNPATITVKTGDSVTWTNQDSAVHNVQLTTIHLIKPTQTVNLPDPPETIDLEKGKSATMTFSQPGTYAYICTYHPGMKGTVIVK